jgi:hypothetical protein
VYALCVKLGICLRVRVYVFARVSTCVCVCGDVCLFVYSGARLRMRATSLLSFAYCGSILMKGG